MFYINFLFKKCKVLKVNNKNCEVEEVDSFTYLGANVTKDGGRTTDVRNRIAMASGSFRRLDSIWKATYIGRKTKVSLFKSRICSAVWMWDMEAHQNRRQKDRHLSDKMPKKDPQNQMATSYPKRDGSGDGRGRQHK